MLRNRHREPALVNDHPYYVISLRGPVEIPGVRVRDRTPWRFVPRLDVWNKVPRFDIGVVTSPFAAELVAQNAGSLLSLRTWVVPGQGTLRALGGFGVAPTGTAQTAEGMLALPELTNIEGRRVAIFTAPGGRGLLQGELARRGAFVKEIFVYDREIVPVKPLPAGGGGGVLWVTSYGAYRAIASQLDVVSLPVVVSSERLGALLRAAGHERVILAGGPSVADLASVLAHPELTELG